MKGIAANADCKQRCCVIVQCTLVDLSTLLKGCQSMINASHIPAAVEPACLMSHTRSLHQTLQSVDT